MCRVCGMQFSTTAYPAPWMPDMVITCVIMFLKIFHICRNRF